MSITSLYGRVMSLNAWELNRGLSFTKWFGMLFTRLTTYACSHSDNSLPLSPSLRKHIQWSTLKSLCIIVSPLAPTSRLHAEKTCPTPRNSLCASSVVRLVWCGRNHLWRKDFSPDDNVQRLTQFIEVILQWSIILYSTMFFVHLSLSLIDFSRNHSEIAGYS
jgi:hypothetical protein